LTGFVTLGPLAFATDRLLALAGIALFLILMDVIGRKSRQQTARPAWTAIIAGVIVARLAFVWVHRQAFADDWFSAFAIWQGGFDVQAGAFAAGVALLLVMRSRRTAVLGFGAVLLCFTLFTAVDIFMRPDVRPMPQIAPLQALDGRAVPLERYRGRPLIINLWATWCLPCRRELPMLAELAETAPVPILLADHAEDADTVRAFLAREGVSGKAVLLDRTGSIARALGSAIFPTTLFLDRRGNIVATHYGEISRAAMLDQIARLEQVDGKE